MKGQILPGHIGVNKYQLKVAGLVDVLFTEISEIASETTVVELPDRTQASGGEETVNTFTATLPAHHSVDVNICDVWLQESRDPVLPTYKKAATLIEQNIHGEAKLSHAFVGLWISQKQLSAKELGNDGEMATITYTFNYDSVVRLPT